MLFVYNIGLRIYSLLVRQAAYFNPKAKQWVKGRKEQSLVRYNSSIWFHFASLGEFEQGRPVLEKTRALYPAKAIVITFFSSSGYEVRKDYPLADAVYYLPLDTRANAIKFIDTINPEIALFTKYEYWYHYFNQLHKKSIPLYIISGVFRSEQIFFKWYGNLHRKMLSCVTHFFLQDQNSKLLLKTIGLQNTTVSGDTRFDRVWENAMQPNHFEGIAKFTEGRKTIICGSTWPADEALLTAMVSDYPHLKFIFVPHEINEDKIARLLNTLPEKNAIRYSHIDDHTDDLPLLQTLIIDNIGMLSSLYQYGYLAYIGGGFGVGIHNTLEAAAFGLPVIFGPNYAKFKEAADLIAHGAGFSIGNEQELRNTIDNLSSDAALYSFAATNAKMYVEDHQGATNIIIKHIYPGN
ncbi:3-deoxy-D-manno-octulosonic acid transferase [Mucilaginibacter hurinus]|uniref:3-deoxy-D-manno-octulosonic acid transferase n=1 Tax=Mucilaginibacter hurinus TaxID=2201324 RepID=A0A367GNI3_9SPHI|nr:glycosyltransferase N-terminal domain-containing protein [Mucilaginibacter hurinus]RCH55029.1 3-deoxy-D-manno-octulosonic acid transferase [Mucilaginibacter hurinus]